MTAGKAGCSEPIAEAAVANPDHSTARLTQYTSCCPYYLDILFLLFNIIQQNILIADRVFPGSLAGEAGEQDR